MDIEPFYVRQSAEAMTPEDRAKWFNECAAEAKRKGAKHGRFSIHPEHGWTLTEAWRERPVIDGELREGEPRWQMTASQ